MKKEIPTITYDKLELIKDYGKYKISEDHNKEYTCLDNNSDYISMFRIEKEYTSSILIHKERSKLAKSLVGTDGKLEIIHMSSEWGGRVLKIIKGMKKMDKLKMEIIKQPFGEQN